MQKKLYRSRENRMVGGILGGIGEFLNVDPTLIRVGFVVLDLATSVFPCIVAYFIAWFIIPEQRV